MLIFQYGSNCLDSQFNGENRLRGDAIFIDIARVDDFEIAFDVWSKNRGCAAADIVPTPGGVVWGALYQVPDHLITREAAAAANRVSLDAIEGEGKNYKRRPLQIRKAGLNPIEAITYTVIRPAEGLQTSLAYVSLIVAGLLERGIDPAYIKRVKAIASANNPAIATGIQAL